MRVVGGTAGGRRLLAPPGRDTRPTSDRVREAVFDMLASRDAVAGARVADLFAGSGAMGIEALSRGAREAVLVERDPAAASVIEANLAALGLGPARVVRREVAAWLRAGVEPFDLAFCDPPYRYEAWEELLGLLPAALVVVESDRPVGPVAGREVIRSRRYGGTVVELLA